MTPELQTLLWADFKAQATDYVDSMKRLRALRPEILASGERIRELTLEIERAIGVRAQSRKGDA